MEIVISIVLLGILGMVGTTMLTGSFSTTQIISTQHLAYSEARYAMERMAREIREIQNKSATISTMTSQELRFIRTGLTGTTSEVRFQYSSRTLSMSYPPAGSATLARDITSFAFTYLDANQAPTLIPDNVRFVGISLTVTPSGAKALSLATRVSLRNL